MYEVETMLGETDPDHIVRTIEYWDLMKRKWPQRQHYAVLVAERITKRFFNVIQILSSAVPLIAIQVNVVEGPQAPVRGTNGTLALLRRGRRACKAQGEEHGQRWQHARRRTASAENYGAGEAFAGPMMIPAAVGPTDCAAGRLVQGDSVGVPRPGRCRERGLPNQTGRSALPNARRTHGCTLALGSH